MACVRCDYHSFDYCARCGAPFCEDCGMRGCCGRAPIESGVEADYEAEKASEVYADLMAETRFPRRAS